MTVVFKVAEATKQKLIDYYIDKRRDKTPPYAIFQAMEEDTVVTLYESGKVMFQGISADVDASMWQNHTEHFTQEIEAEMDHEYDNYISTIGSDEVGTGDFFGPIIVTACFVDKKNIHMLEDLGIQDSKKLKDPDILKLVPKFIDKVIYEAIILNNHDYNEGYSQDVNMNKIKALLHNKVLYRLKEKVKAYDMIIIDEFAKKDKYFSYLKDTPNVVRDVTFYTKAEDKVLSVAAASLISRYLFIKEFDKLSDELHMPLPKGAGNIVDEAGKEIVEKYGFDKLKMVAKLNFRNVDKIKEFME